MHIRRVAALTILLLLPALAYSKPKWSPEYEKKIGTEACAEVEKKWKIVTDEAQQKRLDTIVKTIGAVSGRPEVHYVVKIVDDKDVNAFSIPGGFVYVTKGLLEDAQSDDELAGVLAHEITHNVYYDALERAEKSKKLFMGSIATAIGALILGAEGNKLSAVLAAGEYIRLGVLSKYSMTVETRADEGGVSYLLASKAYNPVGMLTFMERLAARERRMPKQELGVYADHPDTDKRCQQIIVRLEDNNVDINRRAVTKWEPPLAAEKEVEGKKLATLTLWGVQILATDAGTDGKPAIERVQALAEALRLALANGLQDYEAVADAKADPPRVLLGSKVWLTITPQDAQAAGLSPADLARQIEANLSAALHKENLNRWWQAPPPEPAKPAGEPAKPGAPPAAPTKP
ncbi:MAG: M48 family metalloprotease [Armatimonadia bacterium]